MSQPALDRTASVTIESSTPHLQLSGTKGEYIFDLIRSTRTFYERDLLDAISLIPLVGDGVIIDAGANLGNHTVFFAGVMRAKVVAIEPEQNNIALLRRNVHDNSLGDRVDIVEAALWDRADTLDLSNQNPDNAGTFMVSSADHPASPVRAVALDDIVGDRRVLLLKLDIEGAEVRALQGAVGTLRAHRPIVVVEANGPLAQREIGRLLLPLGYAEVHVAGRSDNLVFVHPGSPIPCSVDDLARTLAIHRERIGQRTATSRADHVAKSLRVIQDRIEYLDSGTPASDLADDELAETHEARQFREAQEAHEAQEAREARQAREARLLRERVAELEGELGSRRLVAGDVSVLAASFDLVSRRLAQRAPDEWSHQASDDAIRGLLDDPSVLPVAPVGNHTNPYLSRPATGREKVRIGIATMPGRELGLGVVLRSLATQADEIFVYLNGMDSVPDSVPNHDHIHFMTGPDLGDRGKFQFLDGHEGYYLTCDDDIAYPPFYVDRIVDGIEKYGRQALVGWHGSIFAAEFSDYYEATSRRVIAYYSTRGEDIPVHLLGTGIAGFHTSTLPLGMSDFEYPNMADVWLALKAQKHQVPMVVLAHQRGWADPIDKGAPSISNASIKKEGGEVLDVRARVSDTVSAYSSWQINPARQLFGRDSPSVAIVGRTDRTRWKKGGILKSTHLMAETLLGYSVDARLFDIETGDAYNLGGFDPDVAIVYVGDPERPDFADVEKVVLHHADLGRAVIVNLSLQGSAHRHHYITEVMKRWHARNPGQFSLMIFTESARGFPGLAEIENLLLPVPKTLEPPEPPAARFANTRGVFMGDIAKLSDESLIGGSGQAWVDAVRACLPDVPLYGVQQYKPRFPADFGLDEVWPFMTPKLMSQRLAQVRIMVAPTKFATYEMVPMEVAGIGVPVVYRDMPQSLSETLGLSGVRVERPEDLLEVLPTLYHDPLVWRSFSLAGEQRFKSQSLAAASGHLYLRIKQA
ncbi:MAG: FkbM family methyltransferase, partial [Pedococcus sp.]